MEGIREVLSDAAAGGVPSLKQIRSLGLPDANTRELEAAICEAESHKDPVKAADAAKRVIAHLPADCGEESPRSLAARMPAI